MGTVEIGSLAALITLAISLTSFYIGRRTASHEHGKESGIILTEVRNVKECVDKLNVRLEVTNDRADQRYAEVLSRVAAVEAAGKQLYARMDSCEMCRKTK